MLSALHMSTWQKELFPNEDPLRAAAAHLVATRTRSPSIVVDCLRQQILRMPRGFVLGTSHGLIGSCRMARNEGSCSVFEHYSLMSRVISDPNTVIRPHFSSSCATNVDVLI
jgi:hypothetical protein